MAKSETRRRMMVNSEGEIHEECPDCRGECCRPIVCRNPLHFRTDGSLEPHELGSSCMAEGEDVSHGKV
jgi:hypothetical protein